MTSGLHLPPENPTNIVIIVIQPKMILQCLNKNCKTEFKININRFSHVTFLCLSQRQDLYFPCLWCDPFYNKLFSLRGGSSLG